MRFSLPRASDVRLVLRNDSGRVVRSIIDGRYQAGEHEVPWNADGLPAGLYSAELRVRGAIHIRTVVIEREI
jgi:flagellar hook assembly protein FlgD